jgi:L-lactate utilization protein LutC
VTGEGLIDVFCREARAAGAGVTRTDRAGLGSALAGLLTHGPVVVCGRLDEAARHLRTRGVSVVTVEEAALAALPSAAAGVGEALAGVADTGSVLIGPGAGIEGLLSVLVSHHVVVLSGATVQPDMGTLFADFGTTLTMPGSRFAFITGPSRTSDIELTPVLGVHGPLSLDVVVVDE